MDSQKDLITARVKASFDLSAHMALYRLARFAQGEKVGMGCQVSSGGIFPWFSEINQDVQTVGQSRRILGASFIGLSRVVHAQPSAEFPQLDEIDALVRQQFLQQRAKSCYPGGEWDSENQQVYIHGSQLGYAGVEVGLYTNPYSKKKRVGLQFVPPWHVIRDWSEANPHRPKFVCICHVLDKEAAIARFGFDVAKYENVLHDRSGSTSRAAIRIFEYWDAGAFDGTPRMAYIPGDIGETPIDIRENPFGCLVPFAAYTQFPAVGNRGPVGRIALAMSQQEQLNQIERYKRKALKNPPTRAWDPTVLDEADVRQHAANPDAGPIKMKADRSGLELQIPPFHDFPGMEVQQTILQMESAAQNELTANLGVNDMDRGIVSQTKRTATENQIIDNRSQSSQLWDKRQYDAFLLREFALVLEIGKYDEDELTVNSDGAYVVVNKEGDPALALSRPDKQGFLDKWSEIKISEESVEFQDARAERQGDLQELAAVAQLVPQGQLDPRRFAEQVVKKGGEDPADLLLDETQIPQQQTQALPQPAMAA